MEIYVLISIVVVISLNLLLYLRSLRIKSLYSKIDDLCGVIEGYKDAIGVLKEDINEKAEKINSMTFTNTELMVALEGEKEKNQKIISQKKSSEVRTGQIAEVLVPFLDQFKYDPKKTRFLGEPIDYIVFDDNETIFVEIKSGASKLSPKQNKIKKQVNEGKVRFEIIRVEG